MDATPKLIMRHWCEGGTAITNFSHDQTPIFEAAIKAWGDDGIVLCSVGIPAIGSTALLNWLGSLHDLKAPRDLGGFWDEWQQAKDQLSTPAA